MKSTDMPASAQQKKRSSRIVPVVLICCLAVTVFWEVMSNLSRRPYAAFTINADHFNGFLPQIEGWDLTKLTVNSSPTEPNIVAFKMRRRGDPPGRSILVRLVHGYNMCDCMRIKGYQVNLIEDRRPGPQVWRLTSDTGDNSVWSTRILRQSDFGITDIDVRNMAFPRIGIPDAPDWNPQGIRLSSFRHPIRNLNYAIRAKWNNSRRDLMTFLGLKQPAWADDRYLTLVALYDERNVDAQEEGSVIAEVVTAQNLFLSALQNWMEPQLPENEPRMDTNRH